MSESAGHMDVSGSTETPKETKYFIPKVADLYVGYELESHTWCSDMIGDPARNYDRWETTRLSWPHMQTLITYGIKGVRVPYLTFEKIISQGWAPLEEDTTDERAYWFTNGRIRIMYLPMMPYNLHGYLKIQRGTQFKWHTLFDGHCDSINDFRTILKLL
jgi:hypothetical protein